MENVDVAFPHSSTHLWVVTYEVWTFVNGSITFNNISVIWRLSVLLTEETGNQRIKNTDLLQFTNKLWLLVLSWTIITSQAIGNELSHIETYVSIA
jgi:hypothetical protein